MIYYYHAIVRYSIMVRNTGGGNKGKKQARKHVNQGGSTKTRFSEDADEIYACCQKLLGNGMFLALCSDKKERICIIRNKFKGKRKRDNIINTGTWVLIGKRDFEARAANKLEKCDLLEVYSDSDRHKLKQHETQINWSIFNSVLNGDGHHNDNEFDFVESNAGEISDDLSDEADNAKQVENVSEDEIDIDDI